MIDAVGLLVTPGLIDLHVHVYPGLGDFCLQPDRVGVESGVPTVIDAGTSGAATFGLARGSGIDDPNVRTQVLALMDPCQIYFATKDFICHKLEIANDLRNLDVDLTAAVLEANADVVVGMKVRACSVDDPHVSPFLDAAKQVAGPLPIMVHLGRFPFTPTIPTIDLFRALRPGDVITHAFRGASGMLDSDGKVTLELRDAVERGVQLDVGHSGTDFRFATARVLFDQGYLPTTISTDLNVFNVDHPVISLAQTMTKIWALGVPLPDVIAMTTHNPARVIHREHELGTLVPGRVANVSVLRIDDGEFDLSDGFETMRVEQRLAPVGCVRGGVDRGRVKPAPFDYLRGDERRRSGRAASPRRRRKDPGRRAELGAAHGDAARAADAARRHQRAAARHHRDGRRADSDAGVVRIGANVRHRRLESDPLVRRAAPLLAEAAALIGHPAIRVRGTIGGSLAHADPIAELPAALLAMDGAVVAHGPDGDRTVPAADLFEGFLTTSLAPDEMIIEVRLPAAGPRSGAAFCEWAPRRRLRGCRRRGDRRARRRPPRHRGAWRGPRYRFRRGRLFRRLGERARCFRCR